jgi:perosamine synthetase
MQNKKMIAMFAPYVSEESIARIEKVLRGRWIGQGPLVDEFEHTVEKAVGITKAVAVNCSSSALRLALDISGVGPGDEVITTPMTCTMTNHPILEQYATPVFADIQPETGNIDPTDVERRITYRTKAIVCCHWAGYPCDLEELNRIANRHSLPVIEDASEAFGAIYRGRPIGGISRFTAFSFQAIQLITAGEGGMLIALDPADAQEARTKRWYGIDRERRKPNILGYYDFDVLKVGYGYHLTNIAAAIGLANLTSLEAQQARRQSLALRYREAFMDVRGIALMRSDDDRISSNHFFAMHVERRDDFCRMMSDNGIQVSVVHNRNDIYTVFGGTRSDLPQLERFSRSYIGLPLHMHLTEDDVAYIIQVVQSGW